MQTIKIRYRGQIIGGNWVYSKPKVVELPIPFISKSEKVGEVTCAPVGEFPYDDGMKLLELSGDNGPFVLEAEPQAVSARVEDMVANPPFMPGNEGPAMRRERTEHEELLLHKRINRAKLNRGVRRRKRRSDAGQPKPRKQQTSADTVVQPQADSEPTPQVAAG